MQRKGEVPASGQHTWTPYKFRRRTRVSYLLVYRGLTRYYADMILLRSGLISLREYVDPKPGPARAVGHKNIEAAVPS